MRDIKFRGKSKRGGKWYYGSLITHKTKQHVESLDSPLYNYKYQIQYLNGNNNWATIEVDPKTIGQYTGLKNHRGVEIYEGDIIEDDGEIGVVEWDEESIKFSAVVDNVTYDLCDYGRYTEVYGNIYDNPELLGE